MRPSVIIPSAQVKEAGVKKKRGRKKRPPLLKRKTCAGIGLFVFSLAGTKSL